MRKDLLRGRKERAPSKHTDSSTEPTAEKDGERKSSGAPSEIRLSNRRGKLNDFGGGVNRNIDPFLLRVKTLFVAILLRFNRHKLILAERAMTKALFFSRCAASDVNRRVPRVLESAKRPARTAILPHVSPVLQWMFHEQALEVSY